MASRSPQPTTWLDAGVSAAQVAEWAGHTVEVLLRTYARCLDGGAEQARRPIEEALGEDLAPAEPEGDPPTGRTSTDGQPLE